VPKRPEGERRLLPRRQKNYMVSPDYRRLKADGWVLVRTKGSHHQFRHASKTALVTVPHPKRDLPIGTVRSIFRQAGLEKP